MRSVLWHGRITSTPKAPAKPAWEPGPGAIKDAGVAISSGTTAFAGVLRRCDDEPTLVVESDLSGDTAVGDKELDAIIRLLGGALDDILSGTGGE